MDKSSYGMDQIYMYILLVYFSFLAFHFHIL